MPAALQHQQLEDRTHRARRRSSLAVFALVVSVLPVASVLGPVLGGVALARIRRDPLLEGRALAWAAVAVGSVVTLVTVTTGYMLAQQFRHLTERPAAAMRAAMAGDGAAFREQMTGPGAQVTSAQLLAWTRIMDERFGALQEVVAAPAAPTSAPAPGATGDQMVAAYVLTFERAKVPALILFSTPEGSSSGLLQARIRRITLEPADGTRIVFPDEP